MELSWSYTLSLEENIKKDRGKCCPIWNHLCFLWLSADFVLNLTKILGKPWSLTYVLNFRWNGGFSLDIFSNFRAAILLVGCVDSDEFYLIFLQSFHDEFRPNLVPNPWQDSCGLNLSRNHEFWKVKTSYCACFFSKILVGWQPRLLCCFSLKNPFVRGLLDSILLISLVKTLNYNGVLNWGWLL